MSSIVSPFPWCAIVGDHDVHEKSFANFTEAMSAETHYAFTVGAVRFLALNAFDVPDPGSFTVSEEQLAWARAELQAAHAAGQASVVLLHCYPSDLKHGGEELSSLLREFGVRLVDMGHTHYNEVSNDGHTLFTATRSTGQIEEGPVGYSVLSLDGECLSWKFLELGSLPAAVITSPSDERLLTASSKPLAHHFAVRASFWGDSDAVQATATLEGHTVPMQRVPNSRIWTAQLTAPADGTFALEVTFTDAKGRTATDSIRVACGTVASRARAGRDQDNALEAWPEHGLLATQLGPNKNGKKW